MATFKEKPKPLEVVDARSFTGTHHSAHELVDWVMAHDKTVQSYEFDTTPEGLSRLIIRHMFITMTVTNGGCIVRKQNGSFTVMTEAELFEKYDLV